MIVLLFLSIAVNVLSFSLPRGVQRVTKQAPPRMNIFTDFIKLEQDKVIIEQDKVSLRKIELDLRTVELKMEEKKMNQDKAMSVMKLNQDKELAKIRIIVSIFGIMAFLVFSVQLKDGLLGQATSFNTQLMTFSNSAKELNVSIKNGLKLIAGTINIKPVYNALRHLYKILGDKVLKWRVT